MDRKQKTIKVWRKSTWEIRIMTNRLGNPVGGPEKAGVGGSIPSLATI
jgi:hypothetical protein